MSAHPPRRPAPAVVRSLALATAAVVTLAACATDPAPGTYHGDGPKDFTITLVVDENLTVGEVRFAVTCGATAVSEALTLHPPLPTERGQLWLEAGRLELSGQFERNGQRARGAWHFDQCSGTWKAENASVTLAPAEGGRVQHLEHATHGRTLDRR